jgi:hypothetical protein
MAPPFRATFGRILRDHTALDVGHASRINSDLVALGGGEALHAVARAEDEGTIAQTTNEQAPPRATPPLALLSLTSR